MARGRFNKILEFIGLVDDEPEAYERQQVGAQVYTPPQRRAPESARPIRPQSGYGAGGYSPSPAREYDRYSPGASAQRPPYRPDARASDYRGASRFDPEPPRPEARASGRPEYPRAAAPGYRGEPRAAAPAPAYRSDPIRDEFERIEQQQAQPPRANAVNMRGDSRHQTVIYYLHTLEECRDVITDLIDSKTVLLNLEEMDERTIQRGIDTLCGAAFALGATLRKASDKTYLIAPNNVDVAMTNDAERRY